MTDDDAGFGTIVTLLILAVPLMILGGVAGRYAWDVVVLHVFSGAPRINVAEAIGLTTILTYYTYNRDDNHDGLAVLLSVGLGRLGLFVSTIWVLHFFIPGAH